MAETFRPDYRDPAGDLPAGFNDLPEVERDRLMVERVRLLHVRGPFSWHDDVRIVGNRNGLLVLRDAIDAALATGVGSTTATVCDGEGFGIAVMREDARWDSPAWETQPLPYSNPMARGDGARDPDWLLCQIRFALKQANAALVKRGVKPVADPTEAHRAPDAAVCPALAAGGAE